MIPVGDALESLLDDLTSAGRRARVVRRGERSRIPSAVRSGVWKRDGYACLWCKRHSGLVLDHIVPWSAGGSDDATNLRLLCGPCNEDRSNYRFVDVAPRLPLCAVCARCDERTAEADVLHPAFCVLCRKPSRTDDDELLRFRRAVQS